MAMQSCSAVAKTSIEQNFFVVHLCVVGDVAVTDFGCPAWPSGHIESLKLSAGGCIPREQHQRTTRPLNGGFVFGTFVPAPNTSFDGATSFRELVLHWRLSLNIHRRCRTLKGQFPTYLHLHPVISLRCIAHKHAFKSIPDPKAIVATTITVTRLIIASSLFTHWIHFGLLFGVFTLNCGPTVTMSHLCWSFQAEKAISLLKSR